MVDVCFKEMDLEDFLETHGFLNYDLLSENPVLGAKTVVFDDEVGWKWWISMGEKVGIRKLV